MSYLKQSLVYDGQDKYINFGLSSKNNTLGAQESIDNYIQTETNNNINSVVDMEKHRYKTSLTGQTINFYFSSGNTTGGTYGAFFTYATFNISDITFNNSNFQNSFFILDFYDTYDSNIQNKITSTYLVNLGNSNISSYNINNSDIYKLPIPLYYINNNAISGITPTFITGYTRFHFYNANIGHLQIFYNQIYSGYTTDLQFYFPTIINTNNNTFKLCGGNSLNCYQYVKSSIYINKFNNSITNIQTLQTNYPSGNTFNYQTGTYS